MDNLFKSIEYTIEESVKQYSDAISKKYKIDSKELEKMWEDISSNIEFINKTTGQKTASKKSETKTKKTETKKTETKSEDSEGGCVYLFVRGKNSGSKCGAKTKSGDYCSKHEKFENSTPKSKKSLPKAKPVTTPKSSSSPVPKKINKVIRENKSINKFWHPETQLVFKSKDERVVIGRLKDDKICDLDEDDVKLCESYGFKMEVKTPPKSESTKKTIAKDADIEDVLNKIMEDDDDDCGGDDDCDEDYEEEDELDEEE